MLIVLRPLKNLIAGDFTKIDDELAEIALTQFGLAKTGNDRVKQSLKNLRWGSLRVSCAHEFSISDALITASQINWWWAGEPCEQDEMIACRRCRPFSPPIARFWVSYYGYAYHTDAGCSSFQSAVDPIEVYWDEVGNRRPCDICVNPDWNSHHLFESGQREESGFEYLRPEQRLFDLDKLAEEFGYTNWEDYEETFDE